MYELVIAGLFHFGYYESTCEGSITREVHFTGVDANALVKKWSTLFSLIIDKHAPLRSLQVSEKHCPWISKDLRCLMRCRDRLKTAAVRGNSQLLFSSYRHVRNKVNKLNNEILRQYF